MVMQKARKTSRRTPGADRLVMHLDLPPTRVSNRSEELANAFKALQAANATAKPRRRPKPNTGRFATEEEALDAVVDRLVTALKPEEVWLFGSRARGDHRPESDFDVLVVTGRRDGSAADDYERAYAPVRGLGVGVDVVPYRLDDFVRASEDPNTMAGKAVREGKRLYASRQDRSIVASHVGRDPRGKGAREDLPAPSGVPGVPGR